MQDNGANGMPGPTSMTHFEIPDEVWTQKHAELQSLCLEVLNFLYKNPDIATKVTISEDIIKSEVRSQIVPGRKEA